MLPKIDEHSLSLPSFRIAANGSGPKWLPMTSSSASPESIPTDVFMDSGLLALRLEPESRLRIHIRANSLLPWSVTSMAPG